MALVVVRSKTQSAPPEMALLFEKMQFLKFNPED